MKFQHGRAAGVDAGNEWEMENYTIEERSTVSRTAASISGASNNYSTNSYTPFLHQESPCEARTETPFASLMPHHGQSGVTQQQNIIFEAQTRPARKYYFRACVGILSPLLVLCYLLVVWRCYPSPVDKTSPTAFGPRGANWVFYSWFVAGVVGPALSRYGLAGMEAGMITHPRWKVKNRMQLMLYADGTWSRPSGWLEAGRWMTRIRLHRNSLSAFPGWLWTVLAVPTFIVLIAWLLSALCMEMASGFHHGAHRGAEVRAGRESQIHGQIPGFGAVYTPETMDRFKKDFLRSVPVSLPEDDGVEEVFITAQSETPIEGEAWGLLIHYTCSIINEQADLRLLKDRRSADKVWKKGFDVDPDARPGQTRLRKKQAQPFNPALTRINTPTPTVSKKFSAFPSSVAMLPEDTSPPEPEVEQGDPIAIGSGPSVQFGGGDPLKYRSYRLHDNATLVELRKMPRSGWDLQPSYANEDGPLNIDAVIETAYESWPVPTTCSKENACILINSPDNLATPYCYYNVDTATHESYPGINRTRTFEILLWQGIHPQARAGGVTFNTTLFDLTIDHNITELYGAYQGMNTGPEPFQKYEVEGLTAIGVSCTSSSSVGTTNIDGVRSTFSNFVSTDSPIPSRKSDCARRFGAETLACTLDLNNAGVMSYLFESSDASPPTVDQSDPAFRPGHEHWKENVQFTYLQATQLRQGLLHAFCNYATRLMYNNGQSFAGKDGSRIMTTSPNVTAFVAGKVITPDLLPAGVPVALFTCWALISSGLCLVYGFRKRRSAVLDTETVLKLGVELKVPGFEENVS